MNFLSELYIPPWLGKVFKIMLFRLLENAFISEKMNLDIFAHAARQNSPPGCYNQPPDKGKLLRFFENLFSPSRIGGGGGEREKTI